MPFRYKFCLGLTGIFVLMGLAYFAAPNVLSALIARELTQRGFQDIRVEIGYPSVNRIGINRLEFRNSGNEKAFALQVVDVDVEYHIPGLLRGKVLRINVPELVGSLHTIPSTQTSNVESIPLPWLALFMQSWRSQLPADEVLLKKANIEWTHGENSRHTIETVARLGQNDVVVEGHVVPLSNPPSSLKYHLTVSRENEMRLKVNTIDRSITATLELRGNDGGLPQHQIDFSGDLQAELGGAKPFLALMLAQADYLSALRGSVESRWRGTLPANKPVTLAKLLDEVSFTSENKLNVQRLASHNLVDASAIQLAVNTRLDRGILHWQVIDAAQATLRFSRNVGNLLNTVAPITVTLPKGTSGSVDIPNRLLELIVKKRSALALPSLQIEDFSAAKTQIILTKSTTFRYDISSQKWLWEPFEASVLQSTVQWQTNILKSKSITLKLDQVNGDNNGWQALGALRTADITGRLHGQTLPRSKVKLTFEANPQQVAARGKVFMFKDAIVLNTEGAHSFTQNAGTAKFRVGPVKLTKSQLTLGQLSDHWPYPFDITAGSLSTNNEITWRLPQTADGNQTDHGLQWQLNGELEAKDLAGHIYDQNLPPSHITLKLESDAQHATLKGQLTTFSGALKLNIDAAHNVVTGNGNADIAVSPITFIDPLLTLSQLPDHWPYPFDMTSGRIAADSRVTWGKHPSSVKGDRWYSEQNLNIYFTNINGSYDDIQFAGFSGEVSLEDLTALRSRNPAQLTCTLLDLGIPIEDINTTFAINTTKKTQQTLINVQGLTADLLGGKIKIEPFIWRLTEDKQNFDVRLSEIELSKVIALEQQEQLDGSGVLDGRLPIEINANGIVVSNGQLNAREPGGRIRYRPNDSVKTMAESNVSIRTVAEALNNFQYDSLDATVNYSPAGDLTVAIALKGKNPDWQSGRRVHLNLNVEENVPALLRSLQLADELTGEITKRLQNSSTKQDQTSPQMAQ